MKVGTCEQSSHGTPSTVAKRLARHITFGRSRVLTPVPPDQMWVFFRGFPIPSHRGMSHGECWIGINLSVPTTFLPHPSSPYPSRIFPSAWLKRKKKRAHDEVPESKEKKQQEEKKRRKRNKSKKMY
jgi:hypothetical protein